MICPICGCEEVIVNTNTYVKSKSRSFLWNLFMFCITGGFWLLWMLIRKKKEQVVNTTVATCQHCGKSWTVSKNSGKYTYVK